ncbi:YehR family lipoprotein [Escherichia coli]|nr:YehR family lipoprotein [Escherichia coli]MDB7123920.1 YehR family lipoprotein [Escherichia coli]
MKAFNKLFSLVVASVLVFSLAGCGDKEESKKFSANLNGTEIAITYVYKGDKVLKQSSETKIQFVYKGDKVLKQSSETKIQFASIGATTKEDAARTLEPLSAKYKNIAGVEEKLTYTDTYAQENVTIDMEKVDFKALQGISGINVSAEDAKKGITMAQMELVMKAAGFKEVK